MIETLCTLPLVSALFAVCGLPPPAATGYVEGEYVLVAPSQTARIAALPVARGDRVEAGAVLVALETRDAEIALAEADAALAQAESELADLRQGQRPEEIRRIEAALASARAEAEYAARTAERMQSLAERGVATAAQRDDAATAAEIAADKLAEAEASLAAARLPARPDRIAAAEAGVARARAVRARAAWALDERTIAAPAAGTITDIIRTPGEIAGPGAPVLSFLPGGAVKLRLYFPQDAIAALATGDLLSVNCDGCPSGLSARVSYIADAPEFTPPVIYSLENRQKLVYLVEARPEAAAAGWLRPGQIVDVALPGAEP